MFNMHNLDYDQLMKYDDLFYELDTVQTFLHASKVANLGTPMLTMDTALPTAGVMLDPNQNDRVIFLFNHDYFNKCSVQDLVFIFLHEMIHVHFMHLQRDNLDRTTTDKAELKKNAKLRFTWNIAFDCIVNPWVEHFGFMPSDELKFGTDEERTEMLKMGIKTKLVYPESINYPNFSILSTTSEDVYRFLTQTKEGQEAMDKMTQSGQGTLDSHDWQEIDPNSEAFKDFQDKLSNAMKDDAFGVAQRKEVEKIYNKMAEGTKSNSVYADSNKAKEISKQRSCGSNALGELRTLVKANEYKMDWLKLLHRYIKRNFGNPIKDQWARPNRKISWLWPKILLPTENETADKHKLKVLVSLDASGSMSKEQISQAVRMVRSLPMDKVDYKVISWDTAFYELDEDEFYNHRKTPTVHGGGGTDLFCTEAFIQSVYQKKYGGRPDCIIVVTDGYGPLAMIDSRYQKNYMWVMLKGHDKGEIQKGCPAGVILETTIE